MLSLLGTELTTPCTFQPTAYVWQQLEEKREAWAKAGGGAKAAAKLDGGRHLLPEWDDEHNDACVVCDTGGTLLCCDFCNIAQHPKCCDPPMATVTKARYWACEECTDDMWCDYAGLRRPRRSSAAARTGLGSEVRRPETKAPKGVPRAERGTAPKPYYSLYPEELKYKGIKHGKKNLLAVA